MNLNHKKSLIHEECDLMTQSLFKTFFSNRKNSPNETFLRISFCDVNYEKDNGIISFPKGHYTYFFNVHWFTQSNLFDFLTQPTLKTIFKRYTEFESLFQALALAFPGFLFPSFPQKNIRLNTEGFSDDLVLERAVWFCFSLNLMLLNKDILESQTMASFITSVS